MLSIDEYNKGFINYTPLYNFFHKKEIVQGFLLYNEFVQKNYKGKWPCTTKTLYNENSLIGRLHKYFLAYFETFSVPTAETLFLLVL